MKSPEEMTQLELAAYVQSVLEPHGIKVVLSGGAATSFYCDNKYVSFDVDLVNVYSASHDKIKKILLSHEFVEDSRYFKHPSSKFFIEFPPGPLFVGSEPVREIHEIQLDTGILRIISSTDSVKDRLAAFYHWNDQQCLQQAVLIMKTSRIDLEEVKRWSENEGYLKEFNRFLMESNQ